MAGASVVRAYLGLGSNLQDREANLRGALRRLSQTEGIIVRKLSPVYETKPVGGPAQAPYLNMAVEVRTSLAPQALLDACKAVEADMGREDTGRWGPRIIDVDILLHGDTRLRTPELTIPHPELQKRAFVVVPLLVIAPYLRMPDGTPIKEAKTNLEPIKGVKYYCELPAPE